MVLTTEGRSAEPLAEVAESLGAIVRWARLRYYEDVARTAGLDIERSAISLLNMLARHGPMRTAEISQRMGLDRSTVSRQVASIVTAGLAFRAEDTTDARAALLALTSQGKALHKRLRAANQSVCSQLVADWPPHEQVAAAKVLAKLAERMEPSET